MEGLRNENRQSGSKGKTGFPAVADNGSRKKSPETKPFGSKV